MALSRARESATSSGCDSTDPCISVIEVSTFCTLRHIAAGESDAPTSRRKVNRRRRAESRSAARNEQCSPHVAPLASGQKLLVMLGKEFKEFGGIVDYLMMHRHFAVVKKVPLLAQQLESRQTFAGIGDAPFEVGAPELSLPSATASCSPSRLNRTIAAEPTTRILGYS